MKRRLLAALAEIAVLLAIAAAFAVSFIILSLLVHGRVKW